MRLHSIKPLLEWLVNHHQPPDSDEMASALALVVAAHDIVNGLDIHDGTNAA
jgi:hypothetical protein